jgi:hypothetical protein
MADTQNVAKGIGALAAITILGGSFLLTTCSGSKVYRPNDAAKAAGWTSDIQVMANRLKAHDGDLRAMNAEWSPVISEKDRRYRAIWFDPSDRENVIRAYVDADGQISSIVLTDSGSGDRTLGDAAELVDATIPNSNPHQKDVLSQTLAAMVATRSTTSTVVNGVDFRASSGGLHFTLRARPAG